MSLSSQYFNISFSSSGNLGLPLGARKGLTGADIREWLVRTKRVDRGTKTGRKAPLQESPQSATRFNQLVQSGEWKTVRSSPAGRNVARRLGNLKTSSVRLYRLLPKLRGLENTEHGERQHLRSGCQSRISGANCRNPRSRPCHRHRPLWAARC